VLESDPRHLFSASAGIMSRRQTLAALSPNALSGRASLAPGKAAIVPGTAGANGGGKDGAIAPPPIGMSASGAAQMQSLKPGGLSGGAGRPSMAPARAGERPGGSFDRRSSAFGKPNAGAAGKPDPRPLGDKGFFANCIRSIIAYATAHNYPHALSPKVLTSPTGKDFAQLAFWLFQRYDPTLKTFGKVEDEVPLFFKRLAYPFQLSKSALFAVGSPHSWPSVLAALQWLVELLNYDDKAEEVAAAAAAASVAGGSTSVGTGFSDADDPAGAGQRSERAFFEYACTAYRFFLAGDDARAAAADEEMLGQFRERQAALTASTAGLQQARTSDCYSCCCCLLLLPCLM
jgi:kinetochore protein NDC80